MYITGNKVHRIPCRGENAGVIGFFPAACFISLDKPDIVKYLRSLNGIEHIPVDSLVQQTAFRALYCVPYRQCRDRAAVFFGAFDEFFYKAQGNCRSCAVMDHDQVRASADS